MALRIIDVPASSRYELFVDGELGGFLTYQLHDGITLVHTEIEGAYQGHGLGEHLARFALDDARRRGLTVWPRCPFVAHFIEHHPEYRDLVAAEFTRTS